MLFFVLSYHVFLRNRQFVDIIATSLCSGTFHDRRWKAFAIDFSNVPHKSRTVDLSHHPVYPTLGHHPPSSAYQPFFFGEFLINSSPKTSLKTRFIFSPYSLVMFSPCQTCCKRISQSYSALTGPIVSTRAGLVPRWYQKKKRQKETENHRSKRQQGRRRLWVIRWRSLTECGWRAFIPRSERFMFIGGSSYTN